MTSKPGAGDLCAEDLPAPDEPLGDFAHSFDGYQHWGGTSRAIDQANNIRAAWEQDGRLPDDIDDLRACLFVEARRERFVGFDDMTILNPDGSVLHEPDPTRDTPEREEQEQYKRQIVARIRDVLSKQMDGMDREAICRYLEPYRFEAHPDRALSISSSVVRSTIDGIPVVAVGCDAKLADQITGLLDALHWHLVRHGGSGQLRYVVGRRGNPREMAELLGALGGLVEDLTGAIDVQVEVDFEPIVAQAPDFNRFDRGWEQKLRDRDLALAKLPDLAVRLRELVDDPSFRWHASLNGTTLSGRIDGLQVCTVDAAGRGRLAIGSASGEAARLVRQRFRAAAQDRDEVAFDATNLLEAVGILVALAEDRRSGPLVRVQAEHLLEARVLRGALRVAPADGTDLRPVSEQGQFPAAYSLEGNARFTDALLHDGRVPWVVELKELLSRGAYLRHGIAQAALYRRFLRQALTLHPYFASLDPPLDATGTQAAVAFPRLTGASGRRVDELRTVADLFGVEIIELDTMIDDTPTDLPDALAPDTASEYRVLVRFATEPDDPAQIAGEIRPLLGDHELAIVEHEDIDITLRVTAYDPFAAARAAIDKVESAMREASGPLPELLNVDVEPVYGWADGENHSAG